MKKIVRLPILVLIIACVAVSCKKDNNGDDGGKVVAATPIKKLGVVTPDGTDTYEFTYDDKKRVSKIDNYWNGDFDKSIVYSYAVANKLSITSGSNSPTIYEINAAGLVTKELWNSAGTEWSGYEYDANGYMVKVVEHYDNIDHKKMEAVITNGNVTKHTTYNDAGIVSKVKEFTYTPGDNVNDIHQASMIDNNTKPIGGIFGKPSKKILASLQYWDPRENPVVKKTSTMSYDFDTENRPSKITKTLFDGGKEIATYEY